MTEPSRAIAAPHPSIEPVGGVATFRGYSPARTRDLHLSGELQAAPRRRRLSLNGEELDARLRQLECRFSGNLVTSEQADDLFLRVYGDDVELLHEEHDTIRLPRGDYRVVRQREYVPSGGEAWASDFAFVLD